MSEDQNLLDLSGRQKAREGKERGGIFGWLYRWYDRYDSWSGRWDWLTGFLKTNAAASVATSSAAAVAVGGVVVLTDPDLRHRWIEGAQLPPPIEQTAEQPAEPPVETTVATLAEPPVKVETQRWGSSVIFPIEGKDQAEKRATFDVAVLPTDLTWAHKSATMLVQGGATISEDEAAARIFTPELREGLAQSGELIAVGLASQEGQLEEEAERARDRAISAAGWLSEIAGEDKPIWLLNLGQFRGSCKATTEAADTGWQRPVVIVGIRSQEDGVDLAQAFADAISGKTNLPSRDCYTNFDLTRFR